MNLGLGLRLRSVLSSGGGAPPPSGIPVASTASVVIGNAGVFNNGTYTKKIPEQSLSFQSGHNSYLKTGTCYYFNDRLLLSPNGQVWDDEVGAILDSPFGVWKFIEPTFDTDLDSWVYSVIASNSSVNTDYIPDAGWSPSITITAA